MQESYTVCSLVMEDLDKILPLALKSWKFTYKDIYTEDFIDTYVSRVYRKDSLSSILKQSTNDLTSFVVLVEQVTNSIKGFAQVGYEKYWEHGDKKSPVRLFRIYLDPEILGKGLGELLLVQVEEFVRRENKNRYIVGVHEKNIIGLRFYAKHGFEVISKTSDAEGEIFFEKKLA